MLISDGGPSELNSFIALLRAHLNKRIELSRDSLEWVSHTIEDHRQNIRVCRDLLDWVDKTEERFK